MVLFMTIFSIVVSLICLRGAYLFGKACGIKEAREFYSKNNWEEQYELDNDLN